MTMYIAAALTYYESECLLGVFTTLQRAKNAIARDRKKNCYADEWVVYGMPINEDTNQWKHIKWSNKEDK